MFPCTFPTPYDQSPKLILYLISITVTSSNTATTITCSFSRWPASNTATTITCSFQPWPASNTDAAATLPALFNLDQPPLLLLLYLLFSTLTSLQYCCYSTWSFQPCPGSNKIALTPALLQCERPQKLLLLYLLFSTLTSLQSSCYS